VLVGERPVRAACARNEGRSWCEEDGSRAAPRDEDGGLKGPEDGRDSGWFSG
jgi:hypothetical protein